MLTRPYAYFRAMCWVFLVSFFVVFFMLLLVPVWLIDLLNASAELVGLTGTIGLEAGDLDHVLSLSLMACVIVLAGICASRPRLDEPYWALVTAKVVSTAGFGFLAAVSGGAWLLPAIGDGFVAIALVGTKRWGRAHDD